MIRYVIAALIAWLSLINRSASERQTRKQRTQQKAALVPAAAGLKCGATGGSIPTSIHERLSEEARLLECIDRRRQEEGNPYIGLDIEGQILASELLDLALATLAAEQQTP
jgi:hypothetical protein